MVALGCLREISAYAEMTYLIRRDDVICHCGVDRNLRRIVLEVGNCDLSVI